MYRLHHRSLVYVPTTPPQLPSRCDSVTYLHNKFVYLLLTAQTMLYNYLISLHTSISNICATVSFGLCFDQHSLSLLQLTAARI